MNAVRYKAQQRGSENRAIRATYGSFSQSVGLNYEVGQSSSSSTSYLTPYTGFKKSCDSDVMTLGREKGMTGLTFPWGSYSEKSPMRPLCVSVGGSPGETYNAGDFKITPSTDRDVTLSAKFTLASDLLLPVGFSLMEFTGLLSNMGDVRNVVSIIATGNYTLLTPQINLDHLSEISYSRDALGAIAYDKTNGNMWYIPSTKAISSYEMPVRFQMNLVGSHVLIFGSLLGNTVLPANMGKEMKYIGSWGKKSFSFASISSKELSRQLNITITSESDSNFVVYDSPSSVLAFENIEPIVYYQIGFTGSPEVTLSFPNSSDYVWA
jgi:hypothetical protein